MSEAIAHKQEPTDFMYVFGCNGLLLLCVFLLYHLLFVRKGIKFPGPEEGSFLLIQNSWLIIKHNLKLIYEFDQEYYIKTCGLEAFYFCYFQRNMLKIVMGFTVISFFSIFFAPKINFFIIDESFTASYQFIMTFIYTVVLLWVLYIMMEVICSGQSQDPKTQWVVQHTIHFQGINIESTEQSIFQQIQSVIGEKGNVLFVNLIPQYPIKQLLKQKENDIYMLYRAELPIRCYTPEQIAIPNTELNSGHAFVTVDSEEARNHLLQIYSMTFSCMKLHLNNANALFAQKGTHPIDIVYLNLNPNVKSYIFRKMLINLIMLLLLIFCTTPMSVLQIIGFTFEVKTPFIQYLLLLLVVLLNSLLLLLIDLAAKYERHTSKSAFQISIFQRCVFYLTMNMLIIPALSFLAVNNLYEIIIKDSSNLMSIIQAVYFLSNGRFFVALIFQSACVSLITMLRLDEILTSWLHIGYAQFKRQQYKKHFYLQSLNDNFTYGYYYGSQVAIMYVIMTFSTNIPLIHVAGTIYFLFRCYVDSLNLQTVFQEEMNSNGSLIKRVIISTACSVIPLQILDMVMFALNRDTIYTVLQLAILAATVTAILYLHHLGNKFTHFSRSQVNMAYSRVGNENNIYKHPLSI